MKLFQFILIGIVLLAGCTFTSKKNTTSNSPEQFNDTSWVSMAKVYNDPEWFADAKLGIYFTWGPYSVPAYEIEWYPRWMHVEGHKIYKYHVENYGDPSEFAYHDFFPMFKASQFDPKEWASLFQSAGAKFAGPLAQHHDGFAMWKSSVNPWNAYEMGPKRDVAGEILKEIKALGMKTIATFHHARTHQKFARDTANWSNINSYFPYNPKFATSSTDEKLRLLYGNMEWDEFQKYWYDEIKEVVDSYTPDIIWFDSGLDKISEAYRKKMVALQLKSGFENNKENIVVYKQQDLPNDVGVFDIEQGGMKDISSEYWLSDMTISKNSWSYIKGQEYRSPELLIRNMIDIWSKRGIVLLNLSPTADGVIPNEQREVLAEIGKWIREHEEAVYPVRPYKTYGYGVAKVEDGTHGGMKADTQYSSKDIRFTSSKDGKTIFIYVLGKPEENTYMNISLPEPDIKQIKSIGLVSSGTELDWEAKDGKLVIYVPDEAELNPLATVFKVQLK